MAKTKTDQLLELSAKVNELQDVINSKDSEIEKLQKDLKSANSSKDTWYKASQDNENELKQMHELLDYLPNKIPRTAEDGYTNIKLSVRFAAWLASR